MTSARRFSVFLVLFGYSTAFAQEPAQTSSDAGVLFSSEEMLDLTIEAPLKSIFRQRGQESDDHDAALRYTGADGAEVALEIGLRTRGKFRLKKSTCEFPPLRVNIRTQQAENTVFAGEDKLKLVTHCEDGRSQYEQYVLQEYLVYRLYNLFSDLSFRVRLARITYIDTEDDRDTLTRYAFFIEDEDRLAARSGWEALAVAQVPPDIYDQDQLNLVEIFQYMIGNTDWDGFRKAPDQKACCHNMKVVGDMIGPVFPIPYDFDFSGIVDTRYATPDPSLSIRRVRERVYRGICRPREDIDLTLQLFMDRKEAIYSLYREQEGLEEDVLEDTIEYIDDFYETIENSGRVRSRIERACRRT